MTEPRSIEFQGKQYTEKSIESMSQEELLSLRNLVAENLGVSRINSFKSVEDARKGAWKALVKFDETDDENLASAGGETKQVSAAKPKKEKKPAEPKEPRVVKGAQPATVKRPTRQMFRKIKKLADPHRVKERWDNYKDGMTMLQVIEGAEMTPNDVTWYVANQYMRLEEPTDQEYQDGVAEWCKRNNVPNFLTAKEDKKKEREAEIAKKREEKAKQKAEADAKKAAKAKEAAE